MKKFIGMIALSIVALATSCFGDVGRGTYYTRVNIFYGSPSRILSTNYHEPNMIPAGTKVNVIAVSRDRIRFTVEGNEEQFYITRGHSIIRFQQYLDRMFSKENVFAKKDFTEQEMTAIKAGKIENGMRKKAVLAAYGYPPSHKTPDLYGEEWTYWLDKRKTMTVVFDDEIVVSF